MDKPAWIFIPVRNHNATYFLENDSGDCVNDDKGYDETYTVFPLMRNKVFFMGTKKHKKPISLIKNKDIH